MNEHLKIVFKNILPAFESSNIDYWVYGGLSIAAYAGDFIRSNKDVDVFVKHDDFEKAESELDNICTNNLNLPLTKTTKTSERPKIEIKNNKKEIFSVIPIYIINDEVEFKYPESNEKYSNKILKKVRRKISCYSYFTSENEFIKEMFINHIKARPGKKRRNEFVKDAKAILSIDDFRKLDWNPN